MSYFLVLSTVDKLSRARILAKILLDKRLAACINISPAVESHYVWRGKREKSREYFLFIKTKRALYPRLEKILRQHHPYAVPEIIAVPIQKGLQDYLSWVSKSVR